MTDFTIIKNAPMPPGGHRAAYPFGDMDVGDAFDIPVNQMLKVRSAASWYGTRNNKRFSIKRLTEESYRVWRTS